MSMLPTIFPVSFLSAVLPQFATTFLIRNRFDIANCPNAYEKSRLRLSKILVCSLHSQQMLLTPQRIFLSDIVTSLYLILQFRLVTWPQRKALLILYPALPSLMSKHRDKTTKPTDFHLLEDLTIHSYRGRIIAILKPWIQERAPKKLRLHRNQELGNWLGQLTPTNWNAALDWIDARLKTASTHWNDHWNNHIRFCMMMEPYMTLSSSIKHGDIGLLRHAIREITVILQAPAAKKPKYARAMIRQIHIFDTKASDPQLQEAYLANALVNPHGLPHTFYRIDLLLEH